MNLSRKVKQEWERDRPGLLGALLHASSFGYRLAVGLRVRSFQLGIRKTHTLPAPVISVGNLVVGGVGKTPLVEFIARLFLENDIKTAVLSRGYKRQSTVQPLVVSDGGDIRCCVADAGDEPWMLAYSNPGLAVVVGANRVLSGLEAVNRCGAKILLLDDGYQHIRVARNLNICVLDARSPLGNGRLLPAGPLRELPEQLKRADFLYFTHAEDVPETEARARLGQFASLVENKPAAGGWLEITGVCNIFRGSDDLARLRSEPVVALSGIGSPESFMETLGRVGIVPTEHVAFPDHHHFHQSDIARTQEIIKKCRSRLLITTMKDAVRLMTLTGDQTSPFEDDIEVLALQVALRTGWNAKVFEEHLRSVIG